MGQLEIKNFSLILKSETLLDDITFSLEVGDSLAIIGESGSGKTLLSKSILGVFPQSSERQGEILFENENVLEAREKDWKAIRGKKISYIAQNPMAVFNPMQTIGSHGLELFKSSLRLSKQEAFGRLENSMERMNLSRGKKLLSKYPFQLSGGMLQRIMLAMMMEIKPKLLVADEPTSALDDYNKEKVMEVLGSYKSKGGSLILITHDFDFVEEMAERVLVMKKSKIVESGTLKNILKNPETQYAKELIKNSLVRVKSPMYRSSDEDYI